MSLPPPFVPDESVMTGVGASSGIAIGPALVYSHKRRRLPNFHLSTSKMAEAEIIRMEKAKDAVRVKLIASRDSLPPELQSQAGIIDAHLLLLDDPVLHKKTSLLIRDEMYNAEQAVVKTIESVYAMMENVADEYISSRLTDVEMVGHYVISALLGEGAGEIQAPTEGCILVVPDISPAEMSKIAAARIGGLATETGGHTSHTAIVAQALELPAVVGVKQLTAFVKNGDTIILDGRSGHVIIRPDKDTLDFYRTRQKMEYTFNAEIVRCSHLPAVTLDDCPVSVMGNLELMEELPAIMSYGGEGIGLYRTEFMYMNRKVLPTEEELFETYRRVVESMAPHQVIIRTLDLGYDKLLDNQRTSSDSNQALGLRGIRYCLRNRPLFKTQLRAILRASAFGEVKIMLPMISGIDELRRARYMLGEAQRSLEIDRLPYSSRIHLGIMIEIPATVFIVRELAGEADFFSIGTNDLIQYSLAVDRGNPDVAEMYQPLHPGILRMIKEVLEAGRETGTPVSICGDMAAGLVTAPILVGLGANILSMPPAAIPRIKRIIRMASQAELAGWAEDLMLSKTASEAAAKSLRNFNRRFPELSR